MYRMTQLVKLKKELFDKSVIGLSSQGYKQALVRGKPYWEAPDGCRCAIGHIADGVPSEHVSYSGGLLSIVPDAMKQQLGTFTESERDDVADLLDDLMKSHDWHDKPPNMIKALRECAKKHGLQWPDEART